MLSVLFRVALVLPVLLYVSYLLPVDVFILPSMRLRESDQPHKFMSPGSMLPYTGPQPTPFIVRDISVPLNFQVGPLHYMLVISAESSVNATDNESDPVAVAALSDWYSNNKEFFQESLNEYGGVLFRNFNLKSAQDFDCILGHFHPDMLDDAVGNLTSCIIFLHYIYQHNYHTTGLRGHSSAQENPWDSICVFGFRSEALCNDPHSPGAAVHPRTTQEDLLLRTGS